MTAGLEPVDPWDRLVLDGRVVPAPCAVIAVRNRVPGAPAHFDVHATIYKKNREALRAFVHRIVDTPITAEHPELRMRSVDRVRVLSIGRQMPALGALDNRIGILPLRLIEAP